MLLFSNGNEKVYKVAVLKDWKPYYYVDDKNIPHGFAVDIFEDIADNIGLKYEYKKFDDWHPLWKSLEQGGIDIIPNVGITDSRKDILNFSKPLDTFDIGLFKRKDSYNIKTENDLKDKIVAVVIRNICVKLISDKITDQKVTYQNYKRAIAALSSGEADAMCYPRPLLVNQLQQMDLEEDIVFFGKPLQEIKRAFGIVKSEEQVLKLIDKEISKIKQSGKYEKIYTKWFTKHSDIELSYEQLIMIISLLIISILLIIILVSRKRWLVTQSFLEHEITKKTKEVNVLKDEEMRNQKLLLNQSKVAAIGEMLGNIAHQWRQPITIISMKTANIKSSIELEEELSNEELIEFADSITEQCKYLSKTINDFRNFYTADSNIKENFNIKESILKTEDLIIDAFKDNNITIVNNLEDVYINSNESTFIQSLINICNNSKDAIKIKNIPDDQRYLFITLTNVNNNAILHIKDSGGGIDESIIEKIFEPYFTTKFESKGTGIGLYMTNQIITKHLDGKIEVKNSNYTYDNKTLTGAKFIITIPMSQIS
jgi:signal transduction histidine kinase